MGTGTLREGLIIISKYFHVAVMSYSTFHNSLSFSSEHVTLGNYEAGCDLGLDPNNAPRAQMDGDDIGPKPGD